MTSYQGLENQSLLGTHLGLTSQLGTQNGLTLLLGTQQGLKSQLGKFSVENFSFSCESD